jgi:hypothetical protein
MVRESLGGFASWLTAPGPKLGGIRAEGQTVRSNLRNNPHGMEQDAGRLRRMLHPAPGAGLPAPEGGAGEQGHQPGLALAARSASPSPASSQGPPSPASSQAPPSPASRGSPKPFLRAPWADWD